jgi:glycerol kinase
MKFLLAIDQGTTSSRAILFRADMTVAAIGQQEFAQHFPASGSVNRSTAPSFGRTGAPRSFARS